MATSRLVLDALQTLGMSKVVLLTPYQTNKNVIDYLRAAGVTVLRDIAMKLEAKDFGRVTPAQWTQMAKELDGPDSDGVFLSCTNTTQIEAIADIERALGKPVVNSNQAVLWGCLKRLRARLAPLPPMPQLGRLMGTLNA
jgi:maleate cis-trans isomerase